MQQYSFSMLVKIGFGSGILFLLTACNPFTETTTEKTEPATLKSEPKVPEIIIDPNTSQQFRGPTEIEQRLARALPEIPYKIDNLTATAKSVNSQVWQATTPELNKHTVIKIQALLNWNHHGVGAVDGKFSRNTIKAMQNFQKAQNLPVTETMNAETWNALTANKTLNEQPVLVSYTLTAQDVRLPYHPKGAQYRSVREAVAEKFHMSRALLAELNPNIPLKAGQTITVYNPGQPNMVAVTRVVADKRRNSLYAYDSTGKLIASYPTTVGGGRTPSPRGKHKVMNRVLDPTYNKDFKNKNSAIPPGPNNPVGRVWLGLSKPSYGIHGSPEPELISRQSSAGCVRLTNWDALALFGTIQEGAEVEFLDVTPKKKSKQTTNKAS